MCRRSLFGHCHLYVALKPQPIEKLVSILFLRAFYFRVSNKRIGRNKLGGWEISTKIINGEVAINVEVSKNPQS